MKKFELFKTEHQVQLRWLDNQIAKIVNDGAKSFLNADVAERAYEVMKKSLIISDNEIEHFVSVYLSEVGVTKLVTTLRVYKKRNSAERLQVEITTSNKTRLDRIVKLSGKTKIQIINQLIENAGLEDFQKEEPEVE
jgi:hypothetical protein